MRLHVGTSGYSYKEWRGVFYPLELPPAQMLTFYAHRFSTVEINNTFYRMPKRSVIEEWAREVPDDFRFVIKASRRITHIKRLKDVGEEVGYLLDAVAGLGDKLGLLLFQLPPNMKRDDARLDAFLDLLPETTGAALEVRHESWLDDEVHARLRAHGLALVAADVDEGLVVPLVKTAPFAYLRLRKNEYDDAELIAWRDRLAAGGFDEAWVFFKHEDEGKGPELARAMLDLGVA
ncbi:MAG: DUF72 domain-containing protein [Planctomycetes bacterium]|nr:DUF72 domain-containing protein [Planctomycetota bacterium]